MMVTLLAPGRLASEASDVLESLGYSVQAVTEDDVLPERPEGDVAVSYCYHRRIPEQFIELPMGTVNLHPAPLPEYRGLAVYNFGILNGETRWGCTAHYVDEGFDTGPVIMTRRFDVPDPERITAKGLRDLARGHLPSLLAGVMGMAMERPGGRLPCRPQARGRYYGRRAMEEHRRVAPGDSVELVERKVRAFWCPPHGGAYVELGSRQFTLVSSDILQDLS